MLFTVSRGIFRDSNVNSSGLIDYIPVSQPSSKVSFRQPTSFGIRNPEDNVKRIPVFCALHALELVKRSDNDGLRLGQVIFYIQARFSWVKKKDL